MTKIDIVEQLQSFAQLSKEKQNDARLSWIEQKIVEILWALISVSSFLFGTVIGWIAYQQSQAMLISVPAGIVAWLFSGWRAHRHAFRNAPPGIRFLDP